MLMLMAIACGLSAATIVVLCSCQAVHPSAVRINFDGSVDYVTCVSDASDWWAKSYEEDRRTDDGVDIQPIDDLERTSEGVVVHFHRPEGEWNSIAIGASYHSSVIVEADSMPLGEWRWNSNKNCAIAE